MISSPLLTISQIVVKPINLTIGIVGTGFLIAGTIVPPGYTNPTAETPSLDHQLKDVTARLVGIMDTAAQAAANPRFAHVRMTTCKVKVVEPVEHLLNAHVFLYQEQALAKRLDKPYRQRFMHIAPGEDGISIQSRSFKPTHPKTWIGLCKRPLQDRVVPLSGIGNFVCSVRLVRSGTHYIGQTPPEGCPANYRGAVRITNTITLSEAGMDTSDRGFDASGNQIWGAAADEVYQFRRSNPSTF